jgi:hypothetical protein
VDLALHVALRARVFIGKRPKLLQSPVQETGIRSKLFLLTVRIMRLLGRVLHVERQHHLFRVDRFNTRLLSG